MERSGCPSPSEEELGNIRTEATPISRLSSRPGSAVDMILQRIGEVSSQLGSLADRQDNASHRLESIVAGQSENARLQTEVGNRLETLAAETSRSLHNLQDRLERIESPAPQFAVGSDSNPDHRLAVTSSRPEDRPYHSGPDLATLPVHRTEGTETSDKIRRSERLQAKPRLDYREIANRAKAQSSIFDEDLNRRTSFQPIAPSTIPRQRVSPAAVETMLATSVERRASATSPFSQLSRSLSLSVFLSTILLSSEYFHPQSLPFSRSELVYRLHID